MIPVNYQTMLSVSQNQSEHFVAYGRLALNPRLKSKFYAHYLDLVEEQQERIFEDVDWVKEKCYTYSVRRKVTLPLSENFERKQYLVSPRYYYFLKEFGFIDKLEHTCGNPDCYNPYHQSLKTRMVTAGHAQPHKFSKLSVSVLPGVGVAAYIAAAKDLGLTGEQIGAMSIAQLLDTTLEHLSQNKEKYESEYRNLVKSALLSDVADITYNKVEVDECQRDTIRGLREQARAAGNIDLYVALNDLNRRLIIR